MSAREALPEIRRALAERRLDEVELFVKRGRSRRLQVGPEGHTAVASRERGWAVRAGDRRGSFFFAAAGEPTAAAPWPAPDGRGLRLPEAAVGAPWKPPDDLDAPLLGEGEITALLETLAGSLEAELPAARLLGAFLEEGASRTSIASSRGVAASYRSRAAALWVEAALPAAGVRCSLHLAARSARTFPPAALARRLADRLLLERDGRPLERDRGELLLAPPVAVRLLAGLLPVLLGPGVPTRGGETVERGARIAGRAVTAVDDGRLPGGVLEAPVDGEGVPTRETVLVEEGVFRRPLVIRRPEREPGVRTAGCSRRTSWRDLPTPGPTHLYIRPRRGVAVRDLVAGVSRGYYLLDLTGPPHFDRGSDRFALPVCGFALRGGQARQPVSGIWLHGSTRSVLQRVQEVARDLTFFPLGGMLGAPSMLLSGLELTSRPPAPPAPA